MPISTSNVFGVVSLIFWSVTVVVTLTYLTLVMRASNDGEGGIMALITLLRRWAVARRRRTRHRARQPGNLRCGAVLRRDSMITPAISVLSAVEGLKVVQPDPENLIVPITAAIIVLLFSLQRRGTSTASRWPDA